MLQQDLPTLGGVLLRHLKSYEGLNTVYQYAGLNRGYLRAMLDNQNVGLGALPKEPEYGNRQPEVTKRMMEAWNWTGGPLKPEFGLSGAVPSLTAWETSQHKVPPLRRSLPSR